jgi:hypothetical protein
VEAFVRRLGIAVVFAAFTVAATPAAAQEISLGYQWQRVSVDADEISSNCCTAPFGINFDISAPLTPELDFVGQLDWSRWSESQVVLGTSVDASLDFTTFGGGIRWSARGNRGATPYLQGLLGATHTSIGCEVGGIGCEDVLTDDETSATNFMFQIGGGVAVPMGGLSLIGQFDYRRIFFEGQGANSIRFVAGVRVSVR